MALRVDVPIRVEVEGLPDASDLARIERATGDATLEALSQIRSQFVVPRGRSRTVRVATPEISIDGPLAPMLDDAGVLEQAVLRGVTYGTAASSVAQVGGQVSPFHTVSETVDRGRLRADSYEIPIFDDGTPGQIPIDVADAPFTHDAALDRAWEAHLRRFGAVWDPARFGYPGYYGSYVFEGGRASNQLLYFAEVSALDEEGWPVTYTWRSASMFMYTYFDEDDQIGTAPLDATMDHWVLTRTEEPATAANLLRKAESIPTPDGDEPVPIDVLRRLAARAAHPNGLIYTLTDGRRTNYLSIVPGSASTAGLAHSPIRFIADQAAIGTGPGGSGSGDDGAGQGDDGRGGSGLGDAGSQAGGPLGTGVEGEGTVWPTTGMNGEPLVCKPFLGEPAAKNLARGGEALTARIRRLAAQLEVEPCGYAGQFVLNAATMIGARAHAVGLTSARATTTTTVTVRPDGDGNNGYINIAAGEAVELQYLRLLGDLAVEVVNLAQLVVEVYLFPENRPLIYTTAEKDLSPNATGWALRMYGEFKIENSCMWLFAETCRVILLQQLRSSRASIDARRSRFEDTLEAFTQKLDILGASVVKMSTLRTAIRHARRYRLTGSVRSVLSHRPPPRHYGRGEVVHPPAPIDSVSEAILTQLATASIARTDENGYVAIYQGRPWNDDELEQAAAMRRGVLNMTDPLFLQVAHLDSLYTRFQRDPDSARRYLDDLLDEMSRANADMITETSQRTDGAYFALEASQYLKAQGGVNSRGLRYDLQGLHDLADRELAPHCGSLHAYIAGVNMAIGVKAGWDDFIAIFSTVGIISLAVLCAPLGGVAVALVTGGAGLLLTVHDELEAQRMEDLYRALEDPEAILQWQDVELQRLMANLSWAFSIFDVVGVGKGARAIVGGMRTGMREVAEQGLRGATRTAMRAGRDAVLRNVAGEVMQNAVREAMQATVLVGTMTVLMPVAVRPILVPWIRATAAEHGTLPEVQAVLAQLPSGAGGQAGGGSR